MENQLKTSDESFSFDFIVPDFYDTIHTKNYGGMNIAIYKSRLGDTYFYLPLIIPRWEQFKESLDELKKFNDSSDSNSYSINLEIIHIDSDIENEITEKILRGKIQDLPSRSKIPLLIFPHKFYKLRARVGSKFIELNGDDFLFTGNANYDTRVTLPTSRTYQITGTIKDLNNFYENRAVTQIWGHLYAAGRPFSVTVINGVAEYFSKTENLKHLISDESLVRDTIVETSQNGAGVGLSLGFLSFGGGTQSNTVTTKKVNQRYLNRSYVSNYFSSNTTNIVFDIDGNVGKYKYLFDKIIENLFNATMRVELSFRKMNNGEYTLGNSQIGYATLNSQKMDAILKSKPKIDADYSDSTKASGGTSSPVTVEKNNSNKSNFSNDIEWEQKGEDFIPTKAYVNLISETDFKNSVSLKAIINERGEAKEIVTEFLYPASWIGKNKLYDKIYDSKVNLPVGSIVSFAGQNQPMPYGWKLCNGDEVTIKEYQELHEVIGFKWGKGKDKFSFKLPNLQGQFLRGVDYDRGIITDPDADNRTPLGDGVSRDVGSFQKDIFETHKHPIQFGRELGGGRNNGFPLISSHENSFESVQTPLEGGAETRPKNVYVNFIIKVI